nr:pentapeptide repeat-containing protein [Lachnoclostridium pacaense]
MKQDSFAIRVFPVCGFLVYGFHNCGFHICSFHNCGFHNCGFHNCGFHNCGFHICGFPNCGFSNCGFPAKQGLVLPGHCPQPQQAGQAQRRPSPYGGAYHIRGSIFSFQFHGSGQAHG